MRDDKQHYLNGWIYNPDDGQVYSADMMLKNHDTLNLHGYVLHPIFGSSQVWTRTKYLPACDESTP